MSSEKLGVEDSSNDIKAMYDLGHDTITLSLIYFTTISILAKKF